MVMDVIGKYEVQPDLVPTSNALLRPEVQKEILAEVAERLKPMQGSLVVDTGESGPAFDLSSIVAKTTAIVVQQTIDIPRIAVVPKGEVTTGFRPFTLDVSQLRLQPGKREIVGQTLRTNEQFTLAAEIGLKEQRPEDYVVHAFSPMLTCSTTWRGRWCGTCAVISPKSRPSACWTGIDA